jgi:hypothetical protein
MEIKGTGIKTTRDFVRCTFPDKYEYWLESLPEKTRALYAPASLNLGGWFPMKEGYLIPLEQIVQLLYNGDEKKGGEAVGRFSADLALTGIYKLFLLVATPKYMMQRASTILTTYYIPSEIKVSEIDSKSVNLHIVRFSEMSHILEFRIAGWCIRALELCGCKQPQYLITKSIINGDKTTEYTFSWD